MWAMRSATCRRRTPPACASLVATYGYLAAGEDWRAWGGDGAIASPLICSRGSPRRPRMSGDAFWLVLGGAASAAACSASLGALLWRARREQSLRVELEVLRVRIRSDESAAAERDTALARMREQLQGVFGELARDSLQSNSEMFLQLARERLDLTSSEAAAALKERETAIESLVQPIREALARTEAQIQDIERERIDAFADHQEPDGDARRADRACCRARRAIW